jgi:hypothetical protein
MNRRDVRALGWVVTREVCAELARVALGRERQISIAALRTLGGRWRAVSVSPVAGERGALDLFLATSFSKQREKAVLEFIETLQYSCPDLYSEQVLRQRYRNAFCQAIASFTLGALLACWAASEFPIVGDSTLVLFAIACWSLAIAVQLWRTHRLVRQLRQYRSLRGLVTRQTLARHHDRS